MPQKNLQPALIGGLFIGVLSALPIIGAVNFCCCAWVIGGGMVTAYLMQNASAVALTVGDGALGGLIAGIIGAAVHAVLSIPVFLIVGPMQAQFLRQFMENTRDMPEGLRALMEHGMFGGAGLAIVFISTFMLWLVLGAVFGTIGGMIGAAIFNRGRPAIVPGPPGTPPAGPPPPPPPPQA